MKTDVVTASPNAELFDILISMLDEGQRRRPVIEDGKLISGNLPTFIKGHH